VLPAPLAATVPHRRGSRQRGPRTGLCPSSRPPCRGGRAPSDCPTWRAGAERVGHQRAAVSRSRGGAAEQGKRGSPHLARSVGSLPCPCRGRRQSTPTRMLEQGRGHRICFAPRSVEVLHRDPSIGGGVADQPRVQVPAVSTRRHCAHGVGEVGGRRCGPPPGSAGATSLPRRHRGQAGTAPCSGATAGGRASRPCSGATAGGWRCRARRPALVHARRVDPVGRGPGRVKKWGRG
jgi:hypothetical protein